MEYGKSEYLRANRELIDNLVNDVDKMIRNTSLNYVIRQDSDHTAAYFVDDQPGVEDGVAFYQNVAPESTTTVDEIDHSANDYNRLIMFQAEMSIKAVQTFISMVDATSLTEAELAQPWDGSLVTYGGAEHTSAKFFSDLELTHTTLWGVQAVNIKSAEEITIAHVSTDGLLRRTLMALYLNNEPVRISLNFEPEEDDQMQQWEELIGIEAAGVIYAILVLGMRASNDQFELKLQELAQQLLADGHDKTDITYLVDSLRTRVSAMQADMNFRKATNIDEPTVDDLLEFQNILKDYS